MIRVVDPYKEAFERCGGNPSTPLSDQQWTEFIHALVSTNFLGGTLAERFLQEHEQLPHTLEAFQRDLCAWTDASSSTAAVDDLIHDLQSKTEFLRQVMSRQGRAGTIDVNFLRPVVAQEEALREKLHELEASASEALASQWASVDLFGVNDSHTSSPHKANQRVSPWKFQLANARSLRVEERKKAQYQLRLHQCDESTDQALKQTFFPALQQFREVQAGMAALSSRSGSLGVDDDDEEELAIVLLVRRSNASEGSLQWLDNFVSASRQLALSPYVQQYFGSEDVPATKLELPGAADTTRHYFEFIPSRSLSEVLEENGVFLETSPLFRLYARELLLALLDLLEQSMHRISTRLRAENVMISHSGRRLFLGKLDFGDHIDPFQSSLAAATEQGEHKLLQDLAVVLFSLLHPVTLPQNLDTFRTQYLACRDSKFVFHHHADCNQKLDELTEDRICVSAGDKFAILLTGSGSLDDIWSCRLSERATLKCTDRHYSPMEFFFTAQAAGECHIFFSSIASGTARSIQVTVNVSATNFRLHTCRAQTLISHCASGSLPRSAVAESLSLRALLERHDFFQPLSETESQEAEQEMLERI